MCDEWSIKMVWRAHVLMGALTLLGAWIGTAGTRYLVAQSYWTLLIEAVGSALWWVSLYIFDDWRDYRKLAPTIILASLAGTGLGLRVP